MLLVSRLKDAHFVVEKQWKAGLDPKLKRLVPSNFLSWLKKGALVDLWAHCGVESLRRAANDHVEVGAFGFPAPNGGRRPLHGGGQGVELPRLVRVLMAVGPNASQGGAQPA